MSDWTGARARLEGRTQGILPLPGDADIRAALARIDELERHPCGQHEADLAASQARVKALEARNALLEECNDVDHYSCHWCGERDIAPTEEAARAHVAVCPDHPLRADLSAASTALSLVSGALADAGVEVGPAVEFGARIAEIAGQRDRAWYG